jgi:hypothetical protein
VSHHFENAPHRVPGAVHSVDFTFHQGFHLGIDAAQGRI